MRLFRAQMPSLPTMIALTMLYAFVMPPLLALSLLCWIYSKMKKAVKDGQS